MKKEPFKGILLASNLPNTQEITLSDEYFEDRLRQANANRALVRDKNYYQITAEPGFGLTRNPDY